MGQCHGCGTQIVPISPTEGGRSIEYLVFVKYYSQLVNHLSVDLTQYFVTEQIITPSEEEKIISEANRSPCNAIKMLLRPISANLEGGYKTSFRKMLKIMRLHGNSGTQHIAQTMTTETDVLESSRWIERLIPSDVVITTGPADSAEASLALYLKDELKKCNYTVYCNTALEGAAINKAATALMNCKLFIFVAGTQSVSSQLASYAVALAYLSQTPMLIAATNERDQLSDKMLFTMKLILKNEWHKFSMGNFDASLPLFISALKKELAGEFIDSEVMMEPVGVQGDFWERNFHGEHEVAWFKFQEAFLKEFKGNIDGLYNDDAKVQWLLDILETEILDAKQTGKVTKAKFLDVRGESREKHHFWKVINNFATLNQSMNDIFLMESPVRLVAVENLGKFQRPDVVDVLLRLLDDADPNIRAIAAISLGRTGIKSEHVVTSLMNLLDDKDYICRQSACLSLGHLKVEKAVPRISYIWRNDFISVVRDAAKTALGQIGGPDAERMLKVTKILNDEIAELEGKK